jgi:glyoxylase-like metal-dependent hydrolase (beta-lactamase superfamily II)
MNVPGCTRLILQHLEADGYFPGDVKLILLTHGHIDHAGNAAELKRITGAPLAVHRNDAHMVTQGWHPCPSGRNMRGRVASWALNRVPWTFRFPVAEPDILLEEGQGLSDFGIEGYVLETPGHSSGSISVALEDGHIVVGDALLYRRGVHFPIFWENSAQARASAEKIAGFKPRWLHTGHGTSFNGIDLDKFLSRQYNPRETASAPSRIK